MNCDSDVGSQPGDSRTRERRKFVVVTEGQEPRVGNQEDNGVLGILCHRLQEEIQKREQSPTGGPVCFSCGNYGHKVDLCPQMNKDVPHSSRDGRLNLANGQYRGTRRNQKLVKGPGNEQRSEREGQPLRPLEIKAPLTQVGVSAEISNGNPIGIYRSGISVLGGTEDGRKHQGISRS